MLNSAHRIYIIHGWALPRVMIFGCRSVLNLLSDGMRAPWTSRNYCHKRQCVDRICLARLRMRPGHRACSHWLTKHSRCAATCSAAQDVRRSRVSFAIAKGETVGIVGRIRLRQVDTGGAMIT